MSTASRTVARTQRKVLRRQPLWDERVKLGKMRMCQKVAWAAKARSFRPNGLPPALAWGRRLAARPESCGPSATTWPARTRFDGLAGPIAGRERGTRDRVSEGRTMKQAENLHSEAVRGGSGKGPVPGAIRALCRAGKRGCRNLTPDQVSILRGRRYEREKQSHGGDRRSDESSGQNGHLKTAERIAAETGVSKNTVRRDEKRARLPRAARSPVGPTPGTRRLPFGRHAAAWTASARTCRAASERSGMPFIHPWRSSFRRGRAVPPEHRHRGGVCPPKGGVADTISSPLPCRTGLNCIGALAYERDT